MAKVLKTIDWFIPIPFDIKDYKNEEVYSDIFPLKFNNVVSKWQISYNMNSKFFFKES